MTRALARLGNKLFVRGENSEWHCNNIGMKLAPRWPHSAARRSTRSKRLGAVLIVIPFVVLLGGCPAGTSVTTNPSSDHRVLGITANARPVPPPTQQDA